MENRVYEDLWFQQRLWGGLRSCMRDRGIKLFALFLFLEQISPPAQRAGTPARDSEPHAGTLFCWGLVYA